MNELRKGLATLLLTVIAALLLSGCMMTPAGTFVTMCDNRTEDSVVYRCTTLWVRPVQQVEPMQPAYEWSCVRHPGGMQDSRWLKEW